jgi:hypothetical protein
MYETKLNKRTFLEKTFCEIDSGAIHCIENKNQNRQHSQLHINSLRATLARETNQCKREVINLSLLLVGAAKERRLSDDVVCARLMQLVHFLRETKVGNHRFDCDTTKKMRRKIKRVELDLHDDVSRMLRAARSR